MSERRISVTGLGYVGLPVAVAFAATGRVIGFDINQRRITALENGDDETREVESSELKNADIEFTTDPAKLKFADFHIVSVPTPIDKNKRPDLGPVLGASDSIGRILKKGDIVVYESTVFPGATEEICLPVLEKVSGLIAGEDFFIGYSPERINPGDRQHSFTSIKKVVSGQTPEVLDIIASVYGSVVKAGIHKAPSIKVAEAAKVIENTQRDINISLMNELAVIFDRLEIDTGEVLEAAGTKWNFLSFRPGLVGGHCIGVDPYYLTYKAEAAGYSPEVILSGRRINDGMGIFIADKLVQTMDKLCIPREQAVVTILGFTFKENVPDVRNTRVIDIIRRLEDKNLQVQVHDPLADTYSMTNEYNVKNVSRNDIKKGKAVILAVSHDIFCEEGWGLVKNLLNNATGVVFDIQRILPRDHIPDGIELIRL